MTVIRTTEQSTFYTYVTDISGNAVTGYAGSLQSEAAINGTSVPTTVVEITGGINDGLYEVAITPSQGNVGSGYVTFAPAVADPTYDVSPDLSFFTVNDQDPDSVYNLVRVTSAQAQEINTSANYDRIIITAKEGDEFTQEPVISAANMYQDTDDLTGWTNFNFTVHDSSSVNTSGGSIIFEDDSISVTSTTDPATISFTVNQIPLGLITEGQPTQLVYGDLKGTNPAGNVVTLKNYQITLTRKFN